MHKHRICKIKRFSLAYCPDKDSSFKFYYLCEKENYFLTNTLVKATTLCFSGSKNTTSPDIVLKLPLR